MQFVCLCFHSHHLRHLVLPVNESMAILTVNVIFLTENGVPPSGNTRAVVSQSVAGLGPDHWDESNPDTFTCPQVYLTSTWFLQIPVYKCAA